MHHPRLTGGLGACTVLVILTFLTLLILTLAPPADAASLPVVWSAEYKASTNDAFNAVATAPGGIVYAAGYAKSKASGRTGLMLLVIRGRRLLRDAGVGAEPPAEPAPGRTGSPWTPAAT